MDTKDMTEPQLQRLQGAASALLAALEALLDITTPPPPEANCTCHVAPPCGDCVDHSITREVIAEARAAIAQARGED